MIGTATHGVRDDPLPALGGALTWEIVPGSVTPATAVCTLTSNTLHCTNRATGTTTVRERPTDVGTAAGCGDLPNKATVTADPNLMAMDTGRQTCADVKVVKTPDAGTYKIGDQPVFTITADRKSVV